MYAEFVAQRFKELETDVETWLHAAVGIAGESGELLDAIKKAWIYGKELDAENVKEELGDILFYVQAMANQFGWTVTDLKEHNMAKLIKRYPLGYSDQAAINRADKTQS